MAIIITHPEYGIYLGSFLGLSFWSLMDMAGQDAACTFKTEDEAKEHVSTWDMNNNTAEYGYASVTPDDGSYITTAALRASGFSALLPARKD